MLIQLRSIRARIAINANYKCNAHRLQACDLKVNYSKPSLFHLEKVEERPWAEINGCRNSELLARGQNEDLAIINARKVSRSSQDNTIYYIIAIPSAATSNYNLRGFLLANLSTYRSILFELFEIVWNRLQILIVFLEFGQTRYDFMNSSWMEFLEPNLYLSFIHTYLCFCIFDYNLSWYKIASNY